MADKTEAERLVQTHVARSKMIRKYASAIKQRACIRTCGWTLLSLFGFSLLVWYTSLSFNMDTIVNVNDNMEHLRPKRIRNDGYKKASPSHSKNSTLATAKITKQVQRKIQNETSKEVSQKQTQHLPKALIIGVRKGGTLALLTFLNLHPDIVAADHEMHFFGINSTYRKGLSFYREQMPLSFDYQLTIEKTPSYFIEKMAPQRVYRMNNSIRLLLVVRDPVTRLISDYAMKRAKALKANRSYPPLRSLVLDKEGNVNPDYRAVMISTYHLHILKWLKYFQREQIHIVDGEKLVSDPVIEMGKIERFLGIKHSITKDIFLFKKSKGFYCVKDKNVSSCLAKTKGRKHPKVDPGLLVKLQEYFKPKNKVFFNLIGRQFDWQ